jgi:hypothetical protein
MFWDFFKKDCGQGLLLCRVRWWNDYGTMQGPTMCPGTELQKVIRRDRGVVGGIHVHETNQNRIPDNITQPFSHLYGRYTSGKIGTAFFTSIWARGATLGHDRLLHLPIPRLLNSGPTRITGSSEFEALLDINFIKTWWAWETGYQCTRENIACWTA